MQETFILLWEKLVNIDTGTGYGTGLSQMGDIVRKGLIELGAEVKTFPAVKSDAGFNIVATFMGNGSGSVMAMAHMDTVFPVGTAKQRPFHIEGDWAYGPGVSDCKGSVLLCWFAMKALIERGYKDFGKITLLFNCDEETGSPSSRELIRELAANHDYVLCCEPGQVGDGVVLWRKGAAVLKVETRGRSAHAGSAPQDGRNALMELVHQLPLLSRLENSEKETTVNFTILQAGDRTNVIPDYALAKADVRGIYPDEFDRVEQEAMAIARSTLIADTSVQITMIRNNPPFPQNAQTNLLIEKTQKIYGEIGRSLKTVGAGGASDANWAASAGAVVIDGLGPVKGGPNHTEHERSNVQSVVPRLYLLTRLFMELGS
jgi:glutamate carboxypeptidase